MTRTGPPDGNVMRADWNRRAEEDHKLHIATGHARSEEDFRASGEKDLVEEILDGIELAPDAEALEIGCGVGRLLVPLATRVAAAHGVDISEVMIGKSKEYCAGSPNVTTRVTDGTLEAFADGSLDFVYSFIVFQHIPFVEAIESYVREAGRVLSPGGLLRFQVDGRWRERAERTADTYDGVVFSPDQVRALVESAGLSVVEEWGEETHYHWVTAEKPGDGAGRVLFCPGSYDPGLLADLFGDFGVADASARARGVVLGDSGVRYALGRFELAFAGLAHRAFVEEVLRRMLGHDPEPAGVAYHTRILDDGFEDRASMVDTILSGAEFRRLVRPRVPRVPWTRLVTLVEAGTLPGFFEVVDAVADRLGGLPPEEAVAEGYRLLCNHPPDGAALAFHAGLVAGSRFGDRLLARQLLSAPDARPEPRRLEARRVEALLARLGASEAAPAPEAIESFPGEASVAYRLLRDGADLDDDAFVRRAYAVVLGRPADVEGLANATERLSNGRAARALFLRELLWSEELRSA